jgi:hypothetical protein
MMIFLEKRSRSMILALPPGLKPKIFTFLRLMSTRNQQICISITGTSTLSSGWLSFPRGEIKWTSWVKLKFFSPSWSQIALRAWMSLIWFDKRLFMHLAFLSRDVCMPPSSWKWLKWSPNFDMKRAPDISPIPLSGLTPIIQQGGWGRLLQALVSTLLLVPLVLLLVVALPHHVVVVVVEVVVAAWGQDWPMG